MALLLFAADGRLQRDMVRCLHVSLSVLFILRSFILWIPNLSSTLSDVSLLGEDGQNKSDNGGNFVRGERELREALQAWNQTQIHEFLLQNEVKWMFNPPAAS